MPKFPETAERISEEMISFLQINLNRCKVAHDLLRQTATNKKVDIIIISEQNRNEAGRYSDVKGDAAIAVQNGIIPQEIGAPGRGFVWIRVNEVRI